jgi:hypothetical protein
MTRIFNPATHNHKLLASIIILSGAFSVGYPSQALAVCKPSLSISGPLPHKTQAGAELLARATWQGNAGNLYGGPYAKWGKAQNKQSQCHVLSSSPKRHNCTYIANPCN